MAATKPNIRADVTVEVLGDEAVLYDPLSQAVHYLNPMAALVLQLCDGTATVRETIVELAEANEVESDAIGPQVRAVVKQLRDAGIVVPSAGARKLQATNGLDQRETIRREVPRND